MTPGTNRRRSIFGAVDLATGRCFYQVAAKAVSATFTAFCVHLLAAYPTAPVLAVICDERPVGLGQLLQPRLGPRPATAVAEVFHAQAGYLPRLLGRPQPRPDPDDRRARQLNAGLPEDYMQDFSQAA